MKASKKLKQVLRTHGRTKDELERRVQELDLSGAEEEEAVEVASSRVEKMRVTKTEVCTLCQPNTNTTPCVFYAHAQTCSLSTCFLCQHLSTKRKSQTRAGAEGSNKKQKKQTKFLGHEVFLPLICVAGKHINC
jgi:hypothetical protein